MTLPLDGLTVLDLSRVLAAPFATMILAELGATVIKVEEPSTGDETRQFEPMVTVNDASVSAYYMALNRSKQSITVNLRAAAGQQIVRELAMHSDILVENFPVGSLARRGLDYATLSEANTRLIYLSCTGFGQTGPYAARKGYDTVFQAMGGLMGLTGERGGDPVKPGLPLADLTSALWIAIAVLSAVHGRTNTGRGSHVDFSMLDGQVSLLTIAAANFFATGRVPERMGTEHSGRVPSASFRCTEGQWVHVTGSDQHWTPLCNVLGLEDWGSEPALQTNAGRLNRRDEVMSVLRAVIASWSRSALVDALNAVGVPAGPINDLAQVLDDPHVQARGVKSEFSHPDIGPFQALRLPYRFDGFEHPRLGCPPRLGEHTDQVLRDMLNYPPERIAALRAEGAI